MYVPSEIPTPTKCLPKLNKGQIFSKYFWWAQQTGVTHSAWDPSSKALHWCPVAIPRGKHKARALGITPAGVASPPDPARVNQPPQRGPTGRLHSLPARPAVWLRHEMFKGMFMEQKAPFLRPWGWGSLLFDVFVNKPLFPRMLFPVRPY